MGNEGAFKAAFSLAATVVCMGASPGVMASVGGQTKNAGLKSRFDAHCIFPSVWTGSGSFNMFQQYSIQDFAENAWNRALLLTLPRLEHF